MPASTPAGTHAAPCLPDPVHGADLGAAVDPALCPVCRQPNRCAMEQACQSGSVDAAPCWCTHVRLADRLLAQVPAQARGKACVCARCAGLCT